MVIRIWLLATVLFFTTIESYASKSRLEALGQDSNGSFFIKDERNIFLNPANIHKVDRYLSFEWGASGSAEKVDSLGTPKAEGGWYNGKDGMPFAVYLGNENSEAIAFRNHSSNSFLKPDNTFDFIWGMGAGNENRWGMGVTYSKNKDDVTNNIERSEMFAALQAGALIGENWEVFGQFHLVDEADGASADDDEYKGGLGLSIGTIYKGEQYNYYGMK
ncbi:MAG: hypothetical protein KDD35_05325 [Bdellovibrionales bacterium]|nr:hypothetical protein [Bdellovibrionales bacterium]